MQGGNDSLHGVRCRTDYVASYRLGELHSRSHGNAACTNRLCALRDPNCNRRCSGFGLGCAGFLDELQLRRQAIEAILAAADFLRNECPAHCLGPADDHHQACHEASADRGG